jgi:hypothetical protein
VLSDSQVLSIFGNIIKNSATNWQEAFPYSDYTSDLLYAVIGWIILFVLCILGLIATCVRIFCIQREKPIYSSTVKSALAVVLVASGFFVVYFACVAVGSDTSKFSSAAQKMDCAIIHASLTILESYPQNQTNWSGLESVSAQLTTIQNFFTNDVKSSQFQSIVSL